LLQSAIVKGTKNENLPDLEKLLSYEFKDATLLNRALTHRSWAHEQVAPGHEDEARKLHNEAFEFVGDSVLGLLVAEHVFSRFPDVTEGELSRMKHRIVSASTLAAAAERLLIGKYLRVGRGEEKTGGRTKAALLADAFEAVLAAIYFDGGLGAARDFINFALSKEVRWDGGSVRAKGRTIKAAETSAAKIALERINGKAHTSSEVPAGGEAI
jgi:ribonuclease-3